MPADSPKTTQTATVRVSRKGADRVVNGHPWIYSSDVIDRSTAAAGDVVKVADHRGKLLGVAHYSSTSEITLRFLSTKVEEVNAAFYQSRIDTAAQFRIRAVRDSNAYRVVHAEADRLPALIVDRYGDYLVAQFLNQGMDRAQAEILEALVKTYQPKGILARNDAQVRKLESLEREVKVVYGEIPDIVRDIEFNGLRWQADLLHGQKTGVFLDQRENYAAAARWAKGRALDCFTCTGGFALHLARTCENVEAVDSSETALATAAANAASNGLANIRFREADAFQFLRGAVSKYDTIVLDPPAFAKTRKQVETALTAYKDINLRALRLLNPGGVLVTCSCSHHVSEADLFEVVAAAAIDSGKTLRVLERRAQSSDHPVLLTVPETLYLKCLILELV